MHTRPVSPALGAVVEDVALTPEMDDATVGGIREALLRHKVVWFRGQSLDGASLTALATRFGTPTEAHPVEPSLEGHPQVLPLDSEEGARADVWHSDLTFQECPPLGAILHAVEIPPVGGDTMWADMADAYQALSSPLRMFLEGLTATHSPTKAGGYFAGRDRTGGEAAGRTAGTATRHPVIRVHPETGARSVFVNPLFTDKIDGLRRRESDTLLRLLFEAAVAPERLVRWRWEAGDVAFWDNRCTMHYALLDFGNDRRRMLRVALEGEKPVGVSSP
ncbi:MAG TPA: TauD/TfdA family dioxygenase [Acidimicrobiales bacterium]|nr:TauD/TfdA family dioxygenase [Acidimicrobiales bacterium]